MTPKIVLIPLAVIFAIIIWGAIMGPGGGEHRIDENIWDDPD
ncbi:hypothetical protein PsPphi15_gp14 [Pseudomonas phage phi15]|uniref:Uncharacterized protein n=1 Tax=Pseudomonas phage phi15 TaxID=988656 RepID=F0V6X5_9CAUD|nr:hypothetical protein PsPphi15_gp14 [Pseudomonas phage phi15]CBZ41987.1 hypothetical protein [Pseudomonas phage phi15]